MLTARLGPDTKGDGRGHRDDRRGREHRRVRRRRVPIPPVLGKVRLLYLEEERRRHRRGCHVEDELRPYERAYVRSDGAVGTARQLLDALLLVVVARVAHRRVPQQLILRQPRAAVLAVLDDCIVAPVAEPGAPACFVDAQPRAAAVRTEWVVREVELLCSRRLRVHKDGRGSTSPSEGASAGVAWR